MARVAAFDSDGLWLKSRLFINRALDEHAQFEEAAFWACCALELLGKSALSRISPSLIALPTDDGASLLIAAGAVEDQDSFVTVPAKAVWARCNRAFRHFNQTEAKELSYGRNAYIHSASIGFEAIAPAEWWPRFWALANVLIAHCDRVLEDYVGKDRAPTVEAHLETNQANLDRRVKSLVSSARTRLRLFQTNALSGQALVDWNRFVNPAGNWISSRTVQAQCPACASEGYLIGEEVLDRQISGHDLRDWDDPGPEVTLEIAAEEFACDHCHLVLSGYELLENADLPTTFDAEGTLEDVADLFDEEYNNE